MSEGSKRFIRGFTYVLGSNLTGLLANSVLIFGLPFVLTTEEYGYWQLYQFFSLYLGYVTFGITDGVLLRYAGSLRRDLRAGSISSQFWILGLLVTPMLGLIAYISSQFETDSVNEVLLWAAALGSMLFIPRTLVTSSAQAANELSRFAMLNSIDRVLACVFTVGLIALGVRELYWLVLADLGAKLIALAVSVVVERSLVFSRWPSFKGVVSETCANVRAGSMVLVANLSVILVPGVARFVVEQYWSIEEFGMVSLAFNVSNMLLVVVMSLSITVFPALRRLDRRRYPTLFEAARSVITPVLFAILLLFYVVAAAVDWLIPDYGPAVLFLSILFPAFVYEARLRVLASNFLKAIRRERTLMWINIASVAAIVPLSWLGASVFHSIELTLATVLLVTAIRCAVSEAVLTRIIGGRWLSWAVIDASMVCVFLVTTIWLPLPLGMLGYGLVCAGYWLGVHRRFADGAAALRSAM